MGDEATNSQVSMAAKFGAKIKGLVRDKSALQAQVTDLSTKLGTANTELGTLRQAVLTPDAANKRVKDLEGEIRTGKHKAEFTRLAKAAGFPEGGIDVLYRESGYKAESDVPDAAVIGQVVDRLKGEHAWALGGKGAPDAGETPPPPKPIPGQGRGDANNGGDGTIVTKEQRSDPKFMLNPANREKIAAAAREGRFRD